MWNSNEKRDRDDSDSESEDELQHMDDIEIGLEEPTVSEMLTLQQIRHPSHKRLKTRYMTPVYSPRKLGIQVLKENYFL